MRGSWQSFLVALIIAVSLWFMVSGRGEVEAWTNMRLEMTGMPAGLIVVDGMESEIQVRVRAPKGLMRALADGAPAYPLDLEGLSAGKNVLPIFPGRVPLGAAYEVMEVRPSRLTLAVDSLASKRVPVVPVYEGKLPQDIAVTESVAIPRVVTVQGPQTVLDTFESVEVSNVLPEDVQAGTVTLVSAVTLPDGLEVDPAEVDIAYTLVLRTKTKKVRRNVTVMTPYGVSAHVQKKRVELVVEMPKSFSLTKAASEKITAELVVPSSLAVGTHSLPFRVHLPEGVWLKKSSPETLSVTIQ